MKTLDKKSRLDLLKQTTPAQRELYGSEETGMLLKKVADSLNIKNDASYETWVLTVGDIILGSYSKTLLGQLLKDRLGLTEQQIIFAETELKDFLGRIPQSSPTPSPTVIEFAPGDQPQNSPDGPVQNTQASAVKPLRTFAMDVDMSRAHGYGAFQSGARQSDEDEPVHSSNQDDILKK